MVERLQPDVVTLDLVMPGMDGVEFLRRQMAIRPVPVVVCSISHESGAAALEAFELGAVEFVQKPTALATDRVFEIAEELIAKVKAAAAVRLAAPVPRSRRRRRCRSARAPSAAPAGASAGRHRRHRHLDRRTAGAAPGHSALSGDFPVPIAVVLHMPVGYTEMYAQRLNEISRSTWSRRRMATRFGPGLCSLRRPAGT